MKNKPGLFEQKKMVYSRTHRPATLLFCHRSKGISYARVAFTNLSAVEGTWPATDIPFQDVIGVRVFPTRFKKWLWSLINKTPKCKFYRFKSSKK